jgi:cytoskeletal protein CcmA (bactofilin family)
MFEKLRDKPLASSQERFETLIGRTTQIYGRLVLVDSVRIDGKVVGNIETAKEKKVTVAIGRSGEVFGDITAYRIMVAGKIEGNVYATERAEFHKDSEVRGDITYGTIGVEHGAKLLGLVIQAQNNTSITSDAQAVIKMAKETKSV